MDQPIAYVDAVMDQPIAYVDSDNSSLSYFAEYLSDYFPVIPFGNPLDCIEAIREEAIPFILSKYDNKPIDGLQLFHQINKISPESSKILLIKKNSRFHETPYRYRTINLEDFRRKGSEILKNILDLQLFSEMIPHALSADTRTNSYPIIGSDPVLMEILKMARKISSLNETVLITGETGTGKDLIARYIHKIGSRKKGPLHIVNCAAINPTLFESEFFGHRKGSFTGAVENMEGHFKAADHGVLVLDEVSEIDIGFQVKLLRAIENHEIIPVGTQKTILVDVRIIAISNKDLKNLVQKGRFREDLYHRLNIFPLEVPALRYRLEDVSALTQYFIQRFISTYNRCRTVNIDPAVYSLLKRIQFEGNIRELENLINRVMAMKNSPNGNLQAADFMPFIKERITVGEENQQKETLKSFLTRMEKNKILNILLKHNNNISLSAENLGLSRQNLQYRLRKLKIGTNMS
jgi:DNA-binding NtrC family response regulator